MHTADLALIRLLEELGANALGTEISETVGGWRLRAAPGAPFRRANAVLPIRDDDAPLEPRLTAVERFYADLGLPARYQLSPAARPSDLDAVLEQRGYRHDAPTTVFVADTTVVIERTRKGATAISSEIDDEWIDEYTDAHADDAVARHRLMAYARLLRQIDLPVTAITARVEGALVGIGLGVRERSWVGAYEIGTRPEARRQGVAQGVLHALAVWAKEGGADRMYLQVEEGNSPARALYETSGFKHLYPYWYRVQEP